MKVQIRKIRHFSNPFSRSIKALTRLILIICLSSFSHVNALANNTGSAAEYAVKAAYIYNMLRFVSWDDDSPLGQTESLNICLLKNNPFNEYLEPIKKKSIGEKNIQLKIINSINQTNDCHLIFVNDSTSLSTERIKQFEDENDAILLGNSIEFVEKGALFGFYIEDKKVKLGANKNALARTEINISSLLIEVCQLFGEQQ